MTELEQLERELAEDMAISDAECNLPLICSDGVRWFDTSYEGRPPDTVKSIRYLILRDLLERHPERPELIRVKDHE